MEQQEKTSYYLFIDECGDQNLEGYDATFPLFSLCGILVRKDKLQILNQQIDQLKEDIWGTTDIVFHSREIRRCSRNFVNLLDPAVKESFYSRLNGILGQEGVYVIVCCSILKIPFIERFSTGEDVYGLSLAYLIERSIFHMDDENEDGNADMEIIVERRNPNQNQALLAFYNRLRTKGTKWVSSQRMEVHIRKLRFIAKKENINGLQVADLIAYPISRHVLNPNATNPAYDIISKNIYNFKGALLGLKIIPH